MSEEQNREEQAGEEQTGEEQTRAGRKVSVIQRKLNLSFGLFAMAFKIKRHQLKRKYPTLGASELRERTLQSFEGW